LLSISEVNCIHPPLPPSIFPLVSSSLEEANAKEERKGFNQVIAYIECNPYGLNLYYTLDEETRVIYYMLIDTGMERIVLIENFENGESEERKRRIHKSLRSLENKENKSS